jgi:hypothetical protein
MSSGALKPAAVRFLASIVDRHCSAFGIRTAEGRESVAASTLVHYQRGVTAEQELLEILAREHDPSRYLPPRAKAGDQGYSPP